MGFQTKPVSELEPSLQRKLGDRSVIVFDGTCVLCSHFFKFVLRHDKKNMFSFAVAQSEIGSALYQELGLPIDDFETNLVIHNGEIYQSLDAAALVMQQIGGVWSLFSAGRFLPNIIKDFLYFLIARNRYSIFGRTDQCMLPNAELKRRFIDHGVGN